MMKRINRHIKNVKDIWRTDVPVVGRMISSDGVFVFSMIDDKYSTIDPEVSICTDEKETKIKSITEFIEFVFSLDENDYKVKAEYIPYENTIYVLMTYKSITKEMWNEVKHNMPEITNMIEEKLEESRKSIEETIQSKFGFSDVKIVIIAETIDGECVCKVTKNN